MSFNPDELKADAADKKPVSETSLNMVRSIAEQMVALEAEIEADSAAIAVKNDKLNEIKQKTLPDMMNEIGLGSVKLIDGTIIEVVEQVGCGISPDNKEAAHKWLRDHGFGDLIKNQVTVSFGKGEDKDAELLVHNIRVMADNDSLHFGELVQQESVHSSTLKSFVKEQLKQGTPIPVDTFKIFVGQVAKMKAAKTKKA